MNPAERLRRAGGREGGGREGGGAEVAGHFGEFLQGQVAGGLVLVTLPCPALTARATCRPGGFGLHQPGPAVIGRAGLRRFLRMLDLPARGRFRLRLDLPPGGGAGSSTAARVALAQAAGIHDPRAIARACLASEGATDPLMYPAPERLLWAPRAALPLAPLPRLPRMEILGGFLGPGLRTDPADLAFPDIADLLEDWRAAAGDLPRLGRIAALSAARTLALRGPAGDPTARLAQATGALGWAIAHTGSARALIFPPGRVPAEAPGLLRAAGFAHVLAFRIGAASGGER